MIDFAPNQASWLGAYGRHGVTAQAHGNRVRNESCASSIFLSSHLLRSPRPSYPGGVGSRLRCQMAGLSALKRVWPTATCRPG
jgi:hypothetical protein